MEFVLDTNIYLFTFGFAKKESCELLLNKILEQSGMYSVRICRTIFKEVRGHLTPEEFREF
ncbi:MAG: hypothetical protein KJ976_10510, partial [Proteobacteria bacterium]|nr:hypothetical protein [Pseudomonadota bacterium]